MKKYILVFLISLFGISRAQQLPISYKVENSCLDCPVPQLPSINELPVIKSLPDPFMWSDTTLGRIKTIQDWKCRRCEIGREIQYYETGIKPPPPDSLYAKYEDSLLTVTIIENGDTLVLTSRITIPEGEGPFPAVIGVGFWGGTGSLPPSIFTSRNIATVQYNFSEIAPWGFDVKRGTGGFYKLFPDPEVGFFTAWAWGVSRIIDGLEKIPDLKIDLSRLAITGCSFAGKIALFSAAFDERIALTISQESGGGGYTAWRVTETLSGSRETLRNAQGAPWYLQSLNQFNYCVTKLPYDHHELVAMIAPHALFVTGNPDYEWLADESGHVASLAAREVWKALGVPDRFGFSIVSGHQHCTVPSSQIPEIEAFIDKFLLGDSTVNTNIQTTPYNIDLSKWITWSTPQLKYVPASDGNEKNN
ncbi:alpha/beta hydrolase family protein [Melioribacter sp. OK-6-Me]|uniref:alpha/beta hydrolase family protein n=1 Tax=unclassified Melioribacter TaxID=2627329 RepID=UPI003ED96D69